MIKYYKKYGIDLFMMLITVILSTLLLVKAQFVKGDILDLAISKDLDGIIKHAIYFALFYVGYILFDQAYNHIRVSAVEKIVRDIKNDIFEAVLKRKLHEADDVNRSLVVTRYTTDLSRVEFDYLSMGSKLLGNILIILIAAIAFLTVNYKIASLALVLFSFPLIAVKVLKHRLGIAEKKLTETNKLHVSKLLGFLKGLEAIKNYSIEKEINKSYTKSLEELNKVDMERAKMRSVSNGFSFLSTLLSQALIVIFSALALLRNHITAGDFAVIFSLTSILKPPIYWISQLYESVISSKEAIRVIQEVVSSGNNQIDLENEAPKTEVHLNPGEIEIDHLNFSYDGENEIIQNFSLHVKPGEKVLIKGASGSGKTTFINLITGHLLPKSGKIKLGSGFSIATQDAFLFRGSLKDNISLFGDIDPTHFEKVIQVCRLEKLVCRENSVEKGSNFSGGEKKRIALARALALDEPILILDEPLANIDPENIASIEKSILSSDKTILIVSHQISSALLHGMDRILVLNQGVFSGVEQ